jgi:hypothetical protein
LRIWTEHKKIYAVISIGSSVGNYRVVSKLGAGAMATVYLAEHPRINKKVAIKVINQELATSKEMVSRFMTEARAASQIGHDHIVDILDFGQSPEGENFMIMEYLEGQTISSRIRAAVQTAHAKGGGATGCDDGAAHHRAGRRRASDGPRKRRDSPSHWRSCHRRHSTFQ